MRVKIATKLCHQLSVNEQLFRHSDLLANCFLRRSHPSGKLFCFCGLYTGKLFLQRSHIQTVFATLGLANCFGDVHTGANCFFRLTLAICFCDVHTRDSFGDIHTCKLFWTRLPYQISLISLCVVIYQR